MLKKEGGRRRGIVVLAEDSRLGKLVQLALEPAGFAVQLASSREDAVERASSERPSLFVIESKYRKTDGVALCEHLREVADVPVIFLSADDDDASKVRALRCGDDYLVRPFSLAEFRARVEAILRRAHPCVELHGPAYRDGLLTIDFARHQVSFGGVLVDLTPTERRLLNLLARHPERVFLHDDLLTRVWGEEYRDDPHLLRLHIANLRKKIEADPAHPTYIRTHRGLGYSFVPARGARVLKAPADPDADAEIPRRSLDTGAIEADVAVHAAGIF